MSSFTQKRQDTSWLFQSWVNQTTAARLGTTCGTLRTEKTPLLAPLGQKLTDPSRPLRVKSKGSGCK